MRKNEEEMKSLESNREEKEKLNAKGISSTSCSNFMTIQRLMSLGLSFYGDKLEYMREKKGFWKEEKER